MVAEVKDDYIEATDGTYDNGLLRYVWDKRLNLLSKRIKLESNLKEIPIDRGIWKTMGIFNSKDKSLYLFTSHKNFCIVQKKIQEGYVSHYMYALTGCNPHVSEQLFIDGLEDRDKIKEWRIKEAKKILGDTFKK